MRLPARILAVFGFLVSVALCGVCDVTGVVPREHADQAQNRFLRELISYLEAVSDFSSTDLEIEIYGRLPSFPPDKAIDFYLIDAADTVFSVLYRSAEAASYKKAARTVRKTTLPVPAQPAERSLRAENAELFRIQKGQPLTVVFSKGLITLDMAGVAMQSAAGRESIRVKVDATGKEFIGKITGPLEVRVDF